MIAFESLFAFAQLGGMRHGAKILEPHKAMLPLAKFDTILKLQNTVAAFRISDIDEIT